MYLGIPGAPFATVVEAARAIGADELHALTARLRDAGRRSGLARSTLDPMVSDTRRALREAALWGRVAVIVPRYHPLDRWEEACRRWFLEPRKTECNRQTLQTYASNVLRLRDFLGDEANQHGPTALDRAHLEDEVYPRMRGAGLGPSFEAGVRTALRYAGRVHGEGPYSDLGGSQRLGQGDGYLPVPRGQSSNWDAVVEAVEATGFRPCVIDFLRWHGAIGGHPRSAGSATGPEEKHIEKHTHHH